MIDKSDIPFNVSILELTPKKLFGLKPVTALDIFDGATGNLHEDGLFSISIFGKMGDERRDSRFSYIDIKIPVFHPIIYFALIDIKALYGAIMQSKEYAIWNPVLHDFERSNPIDGETGFHFFLMHWKDIVFPEKKSDLRQDQVKMIEKYKSIAMVDKIPVIPAGLRDVEVSEDGRVRKDEINDFYSTFISVANTLSDVTIKISPELYNVARFKLQSNLNNLYTTIENMIKGKKKLFLNKWASRRIQNGTRNVITSMRLDNPVLGGQGSIGYNNTVVGLYQALKAALPVSKFQLMNSYLSEIFVSPDYPTNLIDKKTLKMVPHRLDIQTYDRWTTDEGLDKLITGFNEESIRHNFIDVEGYYLCLIYKGPEGGYKLFQNIDELPEHLDKNNVSPITWAELFYLTTEKELNKLPAFVTRYPITGIGSIYPSITYIKTTTNAEIRTPMDDSWQLMGSEHTHHQFPIRGSAFINALSPHASKLVGLGADFDGDTCSYNVVYSDESKNEISTFLNSKRAFVGTDGRFISSIATDNVELVLHNLTYPD